MNHQHPPTSIKYNAVQSSSTVECTAALEATSYSALAALSSPKLQGARLGSAKYFLRTLPGADRQLAATHCSFVHATGLRESCSLATQASLAIPPSSTHLNTQHPASAIASKLPTCATRSTSATRIGLHPVHGILSPARHHLPSGPPRHHGARRILSQQDRGDEARDP